MQHVFVWTLHDVIGLGLLAAFGVALIILMALIPILNLLDKMKRKAKVK